MFIMRAFVVSVCIKVTALYGYLAPFVFGSNSPMLNLASYIWLYLGMLKPDNLLSGYLFTRY